MFARSSSSHPTPRPTRRTFVKGLAIGGAAASVGLLRQPAWAQSRQRQESAVLSGTEFDLRIGETEVNLTGAARTALTPLSPNPAPRWILNRVQDDGSDKLTCWPRNKPRQPPSASRTKLQPARHCRH